MFNLPEFHALQNQRCADLRAEAERERLALEVEQAQGHSSRWADVAHNLLEKLSGVRSKK